MSLRARQVVTGTALLAAAVLVAFTVDVFVAGPLIGVLTFAALVVFPVLEVVEERKESRR